jgi:hypothetical protein
MLFTDELRQVKVTPTERAYANRVLVNWLVTSPRLGAVPETRDGLRTVLKWLKVEYDDRHRWHMLQRLLRRATTIRTLIEQRQLLANGVRRLPKQKHDGPLVKEREHAVTPGE